MTGCKIAEARNVRVWMMLSVLQFHGDDYSGIVEVLWQRDAGLRAHKDFFSWAQGLWCDKYTKRTARHKMK